MKLWHRYNGLIIPVLVVAMLTIWPVITGRPANRESAFTILKAVALASSLNILLGYTGYVSFGHIVFYGFGGYMGIYFLTEHGWSIWASMLAGGIASGLLAFLLGSAILRLRGAYFALATIGINEAMKAFINNFDKLAEGMSQLLVKLVESMSRLLLNLGAGEAFVDSLGETSLKIIDILIPRLGGPTGITLNFSVYKAYGGAAEALQMSFYIGAGLALLALVMSYIVRTSKFGLGLLAIRENEDAAEVMGVVTPRVKTWAYVLSAIIPGMIGVLFFFKNGNVEPHDAFPLHASIELLVMVMLGGQGTVLGPILGAFAYQGMRGYLVTSPVFKDIQLSVSGALLLMIVLFIPAGAIGWLRHRIPSLRRVLA